MKFVELPIPVDERVPTGFRLVLAYAKGSKVFLPIDEMPENEENHNCDWEGCGSLEHVASFDAELKYEKEKPPSYLIELLNKAVTTDGAHHKQWYLEQIAKNLGMLLTDHEPGIPS